MLDNFFSDKEETWSDRDQVLSRNTENAMRGTCEKGKSFKKKNDEEVDRNNQKQLNFCLHSRLQNNKIKALLYWMVEEESQQKFWVKMRTVNLAKESCRESCSSKY